VIRSRFGFVAACTLGLAGLLGTAPAAKAEFFEYTSTVTIDSTPGSFTPADAIIANGATSSFTTLGGNNIILTALNSTPGGNHLNGGIGTSIVVLDINANPNVAANEPIAFNVTMTLTITDYPSITGAVPSGGANPVTVTLTGRIQGNLGDAASNLDFVNFTPPPTTAVGGALYSISFDGFASPGADQNGRLSLFVSARAVPEPGSIALLGMGGVGALGMFLRRRARVQA